MCVCVYFYIYIHAFKYTAAEKRLFAVRVTNKHAYLCLRMSAYIIFIDMRCYKMINILERAQVKKL